MALIKFNRSATKADATGSSRDADTLYFPTDEQSIYLGGKRVGGDIVSGAANANHATTADTATTAGSATTAETANRATNANHAKEADHATNADNATNAGTAGKVGNTLTLKLNSGSAKTFNGSADVTFDVTPSGIGAAPKNHDHNSVYSKLGHTHDISIIENAGDAAKRGVDTYISNAPSSSNLPTSSAVKDYVDSQIKNYTSAFRYAGNLVKKSNDAWQINDIPSDISGNVGNIYMDFDTFVGSSEDDSLMKTGFTFYVMSDGTFNGDQVEPGDMVTCVGLYNGESEWAPSYHIVNGNITVTEKVDNSTKVPTSKAVKSAIDSVRYTHPTHTATTGYPTANASPGFGGTFKVGQVASDSQGHVTGQTERTITIPSTVATDSVTGLMSAPDHTKLTTIGTDVSTLKSDVSKLKSDVATLKSDVTTLKSDVSTLKSKVSTLESNVSTLTSALTWG